MGEIMFCKKNLLLNLSLAALLFASCASAKFEGSATVAGKIFDQNGKPVENYEIQSAGNQVFTDSAGIFYLENVKSGKILISGQKKGYTSLKKKIDFIDRKDFVCFEVETISQFYRKIENLVKEKKFDEAKSLLKSEKKSNGNDTIFQFYDTLCDFYSVQSIEEKTRLKDKMEILLEKYKSEIAGRKK